MLRSLILLLVLPIIESLKIGVFDSTATGVHTAEVKAVIDGTPNLEVQKIEKTDIDTVRAARLGGVVAFIGVETENDVISVANEMLNGATTLISPSVRMRVTSYDYFSFVNTVSPAIQDFSDSVVNYATIHNISSVAIIHTTDTIGAVLSATIAQGLSNIKTQKVRYAFHYIPTSDEHRDALYVLMKEDLSQLVVIASDDEALTHQLVSHAASRAQINTGRAWMIMKTFMHHDFESSLQIEGLMILDPKVSHYTEAATRLKQALSVYTASPPNPWNRGSELNDRVIGISLSSGTPNIGIRIHQEGSWQDGSFDVWPKTKREGKELDGVTLKALFKIASPYLYEQGGSQVGFIAELEKQLADILGYNLQVTLTTDPYDDVLKLLGQDFDIAFGDFSINRPREELYDFTQPFLETSDTMIMLFPETNTELFQFAEPFTGIVWGVWGILWLFTAFMFHWLGGEETDAPKAGKKSEYIKQCVAQYKEMYDSGKNKKDEGDKNDSSKNEEEEPLYTEGKKNIDTAPSQAKFRVSCFRSFQAMVGEMDDTVTPSRVFFMIGIMLAALMFSTTYTAQLANLLASQDTVYAADSFSDLLDEKVALSKVTVPSGTTNQDRFEEIMRISGSVDKEYQAATTPDEMVNLLLDGTASVGIYDAVWIRWKATTSSGCSVIQHGNYWNRFGLGFALPKGSPYTDFFSNAILEVRADDEFMNQLEDRFLVGSCEEIAPTGEDNNTEQINIKGFLVIWLLVCGMFIISMFIRRFELISMDRTAFHLADKQRKEEKENAGPSEAKDALLEKNDA